MRRFVAVALCLVVGGCAGGAQLTPTPSSTPGQTANGSQSGHAEELQGPFRLVFELPKTTWKAGEAIDGQATLLLAEDGAVDLGGSGSGLLGFEFVEVGTARRVEPGWDQSCRSYRLISGKPIASPIKKSGGFSPDQPDADFHATFFADPLVHLPAGEWEITAIASFSEGQGCTGPSHTMRASVLVRVTP